MGFVEFFSMKLLGVRLWIWLYLLFGVIVLATIFIWYYREKIKEKYYKFRFPEKTVLLNIHYPGKMVKRYWRLIPDKKTFAINKLKYIYDPKFFEKMSDLFAYPKGEKWFVNIQDKKYEIAEDEIIKRGKHSFPELHYFYNNPKPIEFGIDGIEKPEMTSQEMNDFEEQDFFNKLLTLKDTNTKLNMVMIICVITLLVCVMIALKIFEVIK